MSGRIRTIKPELLEDAVTAGLSDTAFRLFVGMILMSDDYGNFRGETAFINAQVFWKRPPSIPIEDALAELGTLVLFYVVKGQRYGHVRGWEKHQKVSHRGKPRVPGPPEDSGDPPEDDRNDSGDMPEDLLPDLRSPISDQRPPTTREGGGEAKQEEPRPHTPGLWLDAVAEFQAGYHEATGNTLHLQGRENSKVAEIMAKDCPCPSDLPKRMAWSREEGRRFGRACKGRTVVNAFAYRDWASAGRQNTLVPEKGRAPQDAPQRPERKRLDLPPPPKNQNAPRAPPRPGNEGPASGVSVTGLGTKGAANG